MPSWSAEILEKFVAPGVTTFVSASIPELPGNHPEAPHWLANHFLNSALSGSYKHGARQAALAYLRRTFHAYAAYADARIATTAYLENLSPFSPPVRKYFAAVAKWEDFVLQLAMAMDAYRWLNDGTGAFTKGDGSKEFRLYSIANQVKHTSSCIDSGQCTPRDVLPLWLTPQSLSSFGIEVTYMEACEILDDAATFADRLQDPSSFVGDAAKASRSSPSTGNTPSS